MEYISITRRGIDRIASDFIMASMSLSSLSSGDNTRVQGRKEFRQFSLPQYHQSTFRWMITQSCSLHCCTSSLEMRSAIYHSRFWRDSKGKYWRSFEFTWRCSQAFKTSTWRLRADHRFLHVPDCFLVVMNNVHLITRRCASVRSSCRFSFLLSRWEGQTCSQKYLTFYSSLQSETHVWNIDLHPFPVVPSVTLYLARDIFIDQARAHRPAELREAETANLADFVLRLFVMF